MTSCEKSDQPGDCVCVKSVPSDILGRTIKLKVTTSVMRTIKKNGSLDQFLLNTPERKLYDSVIAKNLRRELKSKIRDRTANS